MALEFYVRLIGNSNYFGISTVTENMHFIHKHWKDFTCSVADEQVEGGKVLLPRWLAEMVAPPVSLQHLEPFSAISSNHPFECWAETEDHEHPETYE